MTPSIFPKRKRRFLLKWQLIGWSSSGIPWCHYPGDFVWVFGMTPFLSKCDSIECVRVRQWLREHLTLKCYTCYQRSIMIEKIGFPSVWSCLPLKCEVPEVAMALIVCPWSLFPKQPLCEKRGVWWSICGTFSKSNLESSMRDTMSSCSGGMSKLMERRIHQMGGPLGSTILSTSSDSEPPLSSGSQDKCGF